MERLSAAFAVAAVIGILFLAAGSSVARARGFHGYTRSTTLVEQLLHSERIVFARPDPSDPFRFAAVVVVEASRADIETPNLVDSSARGQFSSFPSDAALFVWDD